MVFANRNVVLSLYRLAGYPDARPADRSDADRVRAFAARHGVPTHSEGTGVPLDQAMVQAALKAAEGPLRRPRHEPEGFLTKDEVRQ